tara:strand:- start:509 stop:3709 length:3201 start_codon:yes stop_codon:yes gene_type:complete
MSFRFNPFFKRRRRKLVKPIRGNPFDNIPKWLYEKTIRQRDPLTRKTRKTKDKKINIPNLQRTLTTLKNKVNEMIEWITRIPIVEQRMEQLEEQYERDIADIRSRLAGHSQGQTHSRYGSSDEDDDFPSYQTGGRVRTLPKPINQQQQSRQSNRNIPTTDGTRGRGITNNETGWSYQQTSLQSFFMWSVDSLKPTGDFFTEPSPNDVIAYFVGDTCAGWAYTEPTGANNFITLPIVLNDGAGFAVRYPNVGDPVYSPELDGHFRYYRAETGEIFEIVNENLCGELSNLYFEDNLIEQFSSGLSAVWMPAYLIAEPGETTYDVCFGGSNLTINLDFGWNLVSFPLEMVDNSLPSVLGTDGSITGVVGDGTAATIHPDPNIGWVGSALEGGLNPFSGYWIEANSPTTINISGFPLHAYNNIYNLNPYEWTLVSYPYLNPSDAGCALGPNSQGIIGYDNSNHISQIIGQGKAIFWSESIQTWIGDLQTFEPGTGYWVKHKGGTGPQMRWNDCSNVPTTSSTSMSYFKFDYPDNQYDMGIVELNEYLHNQLDSYYDSYYENYDKPKSFTKPKPTQSSSTKLYYVKYTTRLTPQQLNEEKSRGGLTSIKHATKRTDLIPSAANVVIVEGGDINQIKQDPNVVLVEEAPTITYHDEINDPFYNNNFTRDQLYLEYIGHRDAIEEFGFGSHSPLLGMMDGSVLSENLPFTDKPPHPDLQGKVTYYQDTNDITVLSQNNIGHGTAVASIITTNTNNEWGGMGGTCPNCSLVYFDSLYSGDGLFPLLEGGLELGVRAANISMGGTQEYWDPGSQIIQDAINDAYNQGLILIVSAGNDDIDIANEFHTYCSYDNTLCVTTSNQYNTDSSGNFINVSAPLGECAACPYSNCSSGMDEFGNSVGSNPAWFRGFNGTSSSAPVVTGLVGLLLSHNPDLTSQDIYDIVTSTNINSSVGNRPGTINFYEALSYMYENYMEDVEPPLGDMNQDGIVNILDAVNLVNLILEVGEIDSNHPQYIPQGDINQDGSIDILDVVNLINMILSNQNTSQRDRRLLERQLKRLSNTIQVGDIVKDMNPN